MSSRPNESATQRLARVLTRDALREAAGERSFRAGVEYLARGAVSDLASYEGIVTAVVRGTHRYRVDLSVADDEELEYSCTCPYFEDAEAFCKHCVAAGLAYLRETEVTGGTLLFPEGVRPAASPPPLSHREKPPTMDDVRIWLTRQSPASLISLLMDQAMADAALRQRLLLRVATDAEGGPNLAAFRRAIDNATSTRDFVDYEDASDYAQGIRAVTTRLTDLLRDGHAPAAMELAEYAIEAVEAHYNDVDDSDGQVGGVLERLKELHHAACVVARPDPESLAARLFEREMHNEWGYGGAVTTYADVLGPTGLAAFRRLAEAEWAQAESRSPAPSTGRRHRVASDFDSRRYRISSIMKALARAEGNIDELVAIKARDLSSPRSFLDIAETLAQAGRHDEALQWAERGAAAFPEEPSENLENFLIEQYRQRGRHEDALALLWRQFRDRPHLNTYQTLKEYTAPLGSWPSWRERALATLRESLKTPRTAGRYGWQYRPADHSELVRVFLWEGEDEAAWQEAQTGGCSNDLWLELAERRERTYPDEALAIYKKRIEPSIEAASGDYTTPIDYLEKVRTLLRQMGRGGEFPDYVSGLRARFKRKRNFLKQLDERGL